MRHLSIALRCAFCCALVSACATPAPPKRVTWIDVGGTKSPEALDRDHYECKRDAFQALPVNNGTYSSGQTLATCMGDVRSTTCQSQGSPSVSTGDSNLRQREQLFGECMKARGWTARVQ